jgi:hypothetical protein
MLPSILIDSSNPTKETEDFPTFPFKNPVQNLYFVSIILSENQVEKIKNLYSDIDGYERLKVNIHQGDAPYADGSFAIRYEFREPTILQLVLNIQEIGEIFPTNIVIPEETIDQFKKRYEQDGVLCFYFMECNHPDKNRFIERNQQLFLNDHFNTFLVLSESKEKAFKFISEL